MTKIIIKKSIKSFEFVECTGHTGYSENGSDILCASVSSLVQGAALGIIKVAGVKINPVINEETGYYKIVIPQNISEEQHLKVKIILSTLVYSLRDLSENYVKYIKLEVR